MSTVREYSYKIKGLSTADDSKIEQISEQIKNINGVIAFNVNKNDEVVDYALDQWSSDYDAFSKLTEICEENGLELIFDEDEVIENVVYEQDIIPSKEDEIIDEPKEIKNKLTKADFVEKFIILFLAVGAILTGFFLKNKPNVQPWIFMIGFTLASYEILYDVVVKMAEKQYCFEEVLTFLGTLILTYQGKIAMSAIIMLMYSALNFVVAFAKHKIALKKEKLINQIDEQENKEDKQLLAKKLEYIEEVESLCSSKTLNLINKRRIIGLLVLALAILVVFVPPLFTIKTYWASLTGKWLYLGTCILVLNSFGEMLFSLSNTELNALINAIENDVEVNSIDTFISLSNKTTVCFDKSGVLTKDTIVESVEGDDDTLLIALSLINELDNHVAKSIRAYANDITPLQACDVNASSVGVCGKIDGHSAVIGSKKFLKDNSIVVTDINDGNSHVFVAKDGKQIGYITLSSTLYNDAYGAIAEIKNDLGVKTEILSSDEGSVVTAFKKQIKADHAIAGASSKFKAERVKKENAVYVGSEVNDEETLTLVDDAITFGQKGKIAVKNNSIRKVPFVLKLATRTAKILSFNKNFIFAIKFVLLALAVILKFATTIDFIWWIFAIDVLARGFTVVNSMLNSSDVA